MFIWYIIITMLGDHGNFICQSGMCVNGTQLCDAMLDCDDFTDEINCGMLIYIVVILALSRGWGSSQPRGDLLQPLYLVVYLFHYASYFSLCVCHMYTLHCRDTLTLLVYISCTSSCINEGTTSRDPVPSYDTLAKP